MKLIIVAVLLILRFRLISAALSYKTNTSASHFIINEKESTFNFSCDFKLRSDSRNTEDFKKVFMEVCYTEKFTVKCKKMGNRLSLSRIYEKRKDFTDLQNYAKSRIRSGFMGNTVTVSVFYTMTEDLSSPSSKYLHRFFFSFATGAEHLYSGIYFCQMFDSIAQIDSNSADAKSFVKFKFPEIFLQVIPKPEDYYSMTKEVIASCSSLAEKDYLLEPCVEINNWKIPLTTERTKDKIHFMNNKISIERVTFTFTPQAYVREMGKPVNFMKQSQIIIKCFKRNITYISTIHLGIYISPQNPTLKFKLPGGDTWKSVGLTYETMRQYPFRLFTDGQFVDQIFFELYERQAVPLGSEFLCEFHGQPKPNVTWKRLSGLTPLQVEEEKEKSILKLTISRYYFQRVDAIFTLEYIYQCLATQSLGNNLKANDSFNIVFITKVPYAAYALNDPYIFDWVEIQLIIVLFGILIFYCLHKFFEVKFRKYVIRILDNKKSTDSVQRSHSNLS